MGLFEFLMVLVSVVIGLGVTEILTGWAKLLKIRGSVEFYGVHIIAQLSVFFALLQQWWELWTMSSMGEVTFISVLVILSPSVFLFLIANLLLPDNMEKTHLKLRAYYYKQAPLVWSLALVAVMIGTFIPPFIFGYPVFHLANMSGIPVMIICIILAISDKHKLHSSLMPVILILILLDIFLSNPAISIK